MRNLQMRQEFSVPETDELDDIVDENQLEMIFATRLNPAHLNNNNNHLATVKLHFLGISSSMSGSIAGYCSRMLFRIPFWTDDLTWETPDTSSFHVNLRISCDRVENARLFEHLVRMLFDETTLTRFLVTTAQPQVDSNCKI